MFWNAIATVSRIPPGGPGSSPDASVVQTPTSVFGGGNGLAGGVSTLSPINRSGNNQSFVFGGGNGLAGSVSTLSPINRSGNNQSFAFGGGNGMAGGIATLSPINRSADAQSFAFGGGNGLAGGVETVGPISRNTITPTASSANNVVTTMGNSAAQGLSVFAHASVID